MVVVDWKGKMAFEATMENGNGFLMDAGAKDGGEDSGPSPLESLLAALGACSAMDVISILAKKRQMVTSYRVEVEGERIPPGDWPRPYTSLTVRHILVGQNLDPGAVERAVQLSDEKYCSVTATLRQKPEIKSEWRIEPSKQPTPP